MASFKKSKRALVSHVDVDQDGTIRIETSSGAVLAAEVVFEALKKRNACRAMAIEKDGLSPFQKCAISKRVRAEEGAKMKAARETRRVNLDSSRSSRRAIRRIRAERENEGHLLVKQTGTPAS